jgi:hypothetical protein
MQQPYQTLPSQENSSNTGSYSFLSRMLGRNSPSPTPVHHTPTETLTNTSEVEYLPVFVEFPNHELTEFSCNFKIFEETASTEQFKKDLLDAGYPYDKDSCIVFSFANGVQPSMEKEKQRLSIIYSSDGSILLEKFNDASLKKSIASINEVQPEKDLAKKFAKNLMSEVNLTLLESVSEILNTPQNNPSSGPVFTP